MPELIEIEEKFKSLGLNSNHDLIIAYFGRVNSLTIAINRIHCDTNLDSYLYSDSSVFTQILIEYIAVMTIGLADILACILNNGFSLGIEQKKLYFRTVADKLEKDGMEISFSIATKIKAITNTEEWCYMYAMNNYVKHNSIIKPSATLNFKGEYDNLYQYSIKKFTYKNKSYPFKSVNEFVNISDFLVRKFNSILKCIMEYK